MRFVGVDATTPGERILANDADADAHKACATALARVNEHVLAIRSKIGGGPAPALSATSSLSISVSMRAERARRASNAGALLQARPPRELPTPRSSAYERYVATPLGQLFEAIIARHGAKFPAVRDELKEKLPRLVEQAGVTTVVGLLQMPSAQLDEMLSPQLRALVIAFAKRTNNEQQIQQQQQQQHQQQQQLQQ